MLDFFYNFVICRGNIRVLNYITFFIYILLFKYLTAHFIYINSLLFAWIELLSKGDFKDVNVT